jgi:cobalt-zinc-cadmium efflux system membrane fusion protein
MRAGAVGSGMASDATSRRARGRAQARVLGRRAAATIAILVVSSLIVAGCGSEPPAGPAASRDRASTALSDPQRQFVKVETVGGGGEASTQAMPARLAYRPQALSAVGVPFSGRILRVLVRPGEAVSAGMPLVVLQSADVSAVRAQVDQAAARSAAAEDQLRRQNEMMARGVGLEVERVEAQARATEAKAELDRARRTLGLAGGGEPGEVILRAPAGGVVVSVRATAGAVAEPAGEPLIEIADASRLWVVAEVAERDVTLVSRRQGARVRVPAANLEFDATVDGLGSQVDPESRRLPVYLAMKTPPRGLTAGMLAEVRFSGAREGLSVPVAAVLIKDGRRRIVYVEREDGRFVAREVRIGQVAGGRVTVLEGLSPGERVVIQGTLLLDGEAEQLL